MNPDKKSLIIQMNETIYAQAVDSFEVYGASMSASFERSPRIAYAVFDLCIRQLCRDHRMPTETTRIVSGYNIPVAEQIPELEEQADLSGTLPPLEEEAQQIVIQVIKSPTLWQVLRRKNPRNKIETVFEFSVPEEKTSRQQ